MGENLPQQIGVNIKKKWVATTQKIPGFLGGNPNESLGSDSSLP